MSDSRTPIRIKHPFECPKCNNIFGAEVTNAEYLYDVAKERDKYRKALEEIATGKIDWTVIDNLTKTRGEIFQDIASEALNSQ